MALSLNDMEKKKAKRLKKTRSSTAGAKRKSQKPVTTNRKPVAAPRVSGGSSDPQQETLRSPAQTEDITAGGKEHTNAEEQSPSFAGRVTMKEQGLLILKKAIGLALDKKQEVVGSSTFQSLYGISKAQVQAQLAKYPKLESELTARVEKLGVCQKAEMIENMLREFAKGEVSAS
jgi:hypothetical protein